MFFEAFGQDAGDANWRKRKRYLRFEGEETSYDRNGDYVAHKKPYLSLAKAFAKLRYQKIVPEDSKAYRRLVKGTDLAPTDVSTLDGLTQAFECLKRIQDKCAEDREIAEAFSYLNKFPIAPFAADEIKQGDPSGSSTTDFEAYLTASHRGNGLAIVPAQTSTISAYKSVFPRLLAPSQNLSVAYRPHIIRIFILSRDHSACASQYIVRSI